MAGISQDEERERNITSLIDSIKEKYACSKPAGAASSVVPKVKSSSNTTSKKKTRSVYKLHIGWKHAEHWNQKPKQVKKLENGGGKRTLEYHSEDPQDVQSLIELGKSVFFPNGQSHFGSVDEMDCKLGNFEGQEINMFIDREGNSCCFQDYLKSYGIFSSRCQLYLITQKRAQNNQPTNLPCHSFLNTSTESANQEAGSEAGVTIQTCVLNMASQSNVIEVKYSKEKEISFNEVQTRVNCFSMLQCQEVCFEREEDENYNPFDDGFYVSSIKKNGKTFVEKDFSNDIINFPQWINIPENQVILHGPDEINGYEPEGHTFVIGIVTTSHAESGSPYIWTKNGETVDCGINHCLLQVEDEGTYTGGMLFGQTLITASPVTIIKDINCRAEVFSPFQQRNMEIDTDKTIVQPEEATTSNTANTLAIEDNEEQNTCYVPKCNFNDIIFGDEIGKGAFGTVFKGEWFGASVAIKTVRIRRMKLAKNKIDRELMVHSQVRHPNIVQLISYCTEGDNLHLVSDFIDGPNLDELLFGTSYEVLLKQINKRDVALQICSAVAYLHNREPPIIHRDIKPENILLDKKSFIAKLCDLGVSKIENMTTFVTTVGAGAEQPGTPSYQPPEVLIEKQVGDKSSDVWSLGCTLFELFTETQVWSFTEVENIQSEMKRNSLPSGFNDGRHLLHGPMINLIERSFCFNPKERQSSYELVSVLKTL